MADVVIRSCEDLPRAFGIRGTNVGPRRGPNRRTQEGKEWYCVRAYFDALARHGHLHYPTEITRAEPPKPDFIVVDQRRGISGLEVTEATTRDWQRELTTTEDATELQLIGPGWDGDSPEIEMVELVGNAIQAKAEKARTYAAPCCDLLIYENSRPGLVLSTERLFVRLVHRISAGLVDRGMFQAVSLIVGSEVHYDLFGEPRRLRP